MKDLVLDIVGYIWSWFGEDTVNRDVERVLDAEYRKIGYMSCHVPM